MFTCCPSYRSWLTLLVMLRFLSLLFFRTNECCECGFGLRSGHLGRKPRERIDEWLSVHDGHLPQPHYNSKIRGLKQYKSHCCRISIVILFVVVVFCCFVFIWQNNWYIQTMSRPVVQCATTELQQPPTFLMLSPFGGSVEI